VPFHRRPLYLQIIRSCCFCCALSTAVFFTSTNICVQLGFFSVLDTLVFIIRIFNFCTVRKRQYLRYFVTSTAGLLSEKRDYKTNSKKFVKQVISCKSRMSDHAALPYKAKRAIEVSQNSQHKTAVCLRERFSSFFVFAVLFLCWKTQNWYDTRKMSLSCFLLSAQETVASQLKLKSKTSLSSHLSLVLRICSHGVQPRCYVTQ